MLNGAFVPLAAVLLLVRPAAADAAREYRIKAAFLYNLTKFVTWPAADPQQVPDRALRLCVAGSPGVVDVIREAIGDRSAGRRPIETRALGPLDEVRACDLAFVTAAERDRLGAITRAAAGASALLVSEADGFGQPIAMINLVEADNRIRLEIDPDAAARARLKLSSKLLGLAKIAGQPEASAPEDPP